MRTADGDVKGRTRVFVAVVAASIFVVVAVPRAVPARADPAWEKAIRDGSKVPLHRAGRLVEASREIEVDVAATARAFTDDAREGELEFVSACLRARTHLEPELRKLLVDRLLHEEFQVQEAACFTLASHAIHDPAAGTDLLRALRALREEDVDLLQLSHHWDLPVCSTVFRPLLQKALLEGGVSPRDGWKAFRTLRPLFERMLHGTAEAREELLMFLSGVLDGAGSDPRADAWALDLLLDLAIGEKGEDGAESRKEVGIWVGELPREERFASSLSRATKHLAAWNEKDLPGARLAWTWSLAGLGIDTPEFDREIRRALADEDPRIRRAAADVVAKRGASPDVQRLCLESLDASRHGRLALSIALRLDDASLPDLVAGIGTWEALHGLSRSRHPGPRGKQVLRDLTGDELWKGRPWLWLVGADRLRAAGEPVPHFWSRVTDLILGLVENPFPDDEPGYVDPPGYHPGLPLGRVLPPWGTRPDPQAERRIAGGLGNLGHEKLCAAVKLLCTLGVRSDVIAGSLRAIVADEKRPLGERLSVTAAARRMMPDEVWPADVIWRALRSTDADVRAAGVRAAGSRLGVVGDERMEAEIVRLASSEYWLTCIEAINALPPSSEGLRRTLARNARSPSPWVAAEVLDRLEGLCSEAGVRPWVDLLVEALDAPFPGHADRVVAILLEDEANGAAVRSAVGKRLAGEASPRWKARANSLLEELERRGR